MLSNIGCGKTRSNFAVICSFVDPVNPSGVTVGPAHCGIVFSKSSFRLAKRHVIGH